MIRPIKKVLVTGAAGFVGSHMTETLLREGYEVIALIRETGLIHSSKGLNPKVVQGDFGDLKILREVLPQVDAVFHLAAFIPPDYEDPQYAQQCLLTNGFKTFQLAQAVSENPGCRLVYFSAGTTYAYSAVPVTEDSPIYPSGKAFYYSMSKLVGEYYVEQQRTLNKLPTLILRVGSCYGWGMKNKSVIASFMQRAHDGLPLQLWDGGTATYDFVYIQDVVEAALAAIQQEVQGIYNVGSGCAISVVELAKTVAEIFQDQNITIDMKSKASSAFKGFPALSIHKIQKSLNFRPRSLKEGLLEYRSSMGIKEEHQGGGRL